MVFKVRCTEVEPTKHIGCKGVLRDAWNGTLPPRLAMLLVDQRLAKMHRGALPSPRPRGHPSHGASKLGLKGGRRIDRSKERRDHILLAGTLHHD